MCGICGRYNREEPVDSAQIARMNATMVHRGPDAGGVFVEGPLGLGHRRLSIIDLSGGAQPMHSDDGTLVIVFNGEVYNFAQLRSELQQRGRAFTTTSDTEVILQMYREYGPSCVARLRGMFAFAIYDKVQRSLFLARDRLGIKPLYYSFEGGTFLFGSEIKPLLEGGGPVDASVNIRAVCDFFTYQYIPAPGSIYRGIRKLPAGHTLMLRDGKLTVEQYWDMDFSRTVTMCEDDWVEGLLETMRDAVRVRLVADVPLGAFLSGGIDSSLVVAFMSQLCAEPVKTNSIGFRESAFDEAGYARDTARLFGTAHREHTVSMDCLAALDILGYHFDEPFGDTSSLPTYYVSRMTRENVTVALSGDGGDENFAGYAKYRSDMTENRVRGVIPALVRRSVVAGLARVYPKADWLPRVLRAKTALTSIAREPVDGAFHSMEHFTAQERRLLFNTDVNRELAGYDPSDVYRRFFHQAPAEDFLSRTQYADIKMYLCDDILVKVDRASMAAGLEARVPLLDHQFMEFAATIPSGLKLKGGCGKYILKKAASRLLPERILNRKKRGFSIPVDAWFRSELRAPFESEVLGNRALMERYFNPEHVSRMWREHQAGVRTYGTHLWSLLMFAKWSRRFEGV